MLSLFGLVVMLLAETVLCLAGLCCYVETTVLDTCVFVANSGVRLTAQNMGVGGKEFSLAEDIRLLNPA